MSPTISSAVVILFCTPHIRYVKMCRACKSHSTMIFDSAAFGLWETIRSRIFCVCVFFVIMSCVTCVNSLIRIITVLVWPLLIAIDISIPHLYRPRFNIARCTSVFLCFFLPLFLDVCLSVPTCIFLHFSHFLSLPPSPSLSHTIVPIVIFDPPQFQIK